MRDRRCEGKAGEMVWGWRWDKHLAPLRKAGRVGGCVLEEGRPGLRRVLCTFGPICYRVKVSMTEINTKRPDGSNQRPAQRTEAR